MARRLRSVLLVLAAGCGRPALVVPRASGPITLDGELGEASWTRAARTGPFLEHGRPAAPYSEARLLHDGRDLYLGLYAADEDIRSGQDAFTVHLGATTLRLGPRPDGADGVRAAVDTDGTIDDASDDDEEWVVEAAVPLARLGVLPGGVLDVALERCDEPKDGVRRCGTITTRVRLAE